MVSGSGGRFLKARPPTGRIRLPYWVSHSSSLTGSLWVALSALRRKFMLCWPSCDHVSNRPTMYARIQPCTRNDAKHACG
jgi:hypothetical protein